MANIINWSGYQWLTQERWGNIHSDKLFCYYNPSCVIVDNYQYLHLLTKRDPKKFTIKQNQQQTLVESPMAIGLISSRNMFGYGYYEIEAKLPIGDNLWPAFWMWAESGWPPEIDVFEAYTQKNKGYFNLSLNSLYKIESNFHYVDIKTGKNTMSGAKRHFFGTKDPSKHFIKYALKYSPDEISIFYDGKLVRSLDKGLLPYFRDQNMNVIINNGFTKDVDLEKENYSNFIVKHFKYDPL
jgi:beta-glucanase (GH16 family)